MSELLIVPVSLREANRYVETVHRHHGATRGMKFAVGVADRAGVLRGVGIAGVHDSRGEGCGPRGGTARLGELIPLCSEWSEPWAFHVVMANPRPLAEPIPYKGALGLRHLPTDIEDQIRRQVNL